MENKFSKEPLVIKEEKNDNENYQGVGSFILEIIKIIALAFIIIVPIRVFLFQPFFVQGSSMEPNFEDGQYLIVNEFGYKETDLSISSTNLFNVKPFKVAARQSVVVFRYPLDPSKFFIKRVIGLPGETVQVKDDQVTVFNKTHPDGFVLNESTYLSSSVMTSGDDKITLGPDQYFVMGDNREFSSDSRAWGPVPVSDLIGEVELRAWPLNKISVY
ncbi:MAG: signal peptidase I [Candidatus Pacebacteria bacterium]|nr:signal peptidase I [Candidatus Paceibacterota bacterium]